ncbi:MAG: sulfur carrier protein ThiS [Nitrospirales bacterium]|nr:sulfur carrier protein ThiS [Nitrospira sp.]MDR4502948.1 sulfur carrier protein ThiS [Nitrospirales bacterium]
MQISINGKQETVEAATVLDVLNVKEIDPQLVAVELNTEVVEREQLPTTTIKDGDKLEFLFYMGGGA